MRILMISDVYFPRVNGVSTSILTFKKQLETTGHHVTLIAPSYGPDELPDNSIIRIPSRYIILDPEDRMMKINQITTLTESLEKEKFDLIHIQTPFIAHYAGIKLAKKLKLPVVETYHTFFEEYFYHYIPFLPKSSLRFIARRFTKSQCNDVNAVIAPSNAMRTKLQDYGVRTPISIIPTGMETNDFKNGNGKQFREKFNIPEDRPTLIHVGRVAHEKNIDFLLYVLDAVKKSIPKILLVIAGEGPALPHLKSLSQKLNLYDNILFVGYLSRDKELLDCYLAGDLFIFASKTETQGLVLLESMMLGTPVISTAFMGTKDILEPEQGSIIANDDVDDFAKKVLSVLQNKDLHEKLSAEAKEYALTWSSEALTKKMLNFYDDVIQEPQ